MAAGQKSREWAFMEGFEEEMEMGCMRAGSTELVALALAPAAARAARAEAKLAARLSLRGSAGCCCCRSGAEVLLRPWMWL